jgi:hypothetical protein
MEDADMAWCVPNTLTLGASHLNLSRNAGEVLSQH